MRVKLDGLLRDEAAVDDELEGQSRMIRCRFNADHPRQHVKETKDKYFHFCTAC